MLAGRNGTGVFVTEGGPGKARELRLGEPLRALPDALARSHAASKATPTERVC